jgi:hypothetical protein
MVNLAGGVQTNTWHALQLELHWRASEIADMPQSLRDNLYRVLHDLIDTFDVHGPIATFHGSEAYGSGSPYRMSMDEWTNFNGICGHQHVPENEHWDPGPIDLSGLFEVKERRRAMYGDGILLAASCPGPNGKGALGVAPDGSFYNLHAQLAVPQGWVLGPNGQEYWGDRKAVAIAVTGDNSWVITADTGEDYNFPYDPGA